MVATSDEAEAFKGVNVAIVIGGWPRRDGMERKDLISKNVTIYKSQASALQQHAAPNCKVNDDASRIRKYTISMLKHYCYYGTVKKKRARTDIYSDFAVQVCTHEVLFETISTYIHT